MWTINPFQGHLVLKVRELLLIISVGSGSTPGATPLRPSFSVPGAVRAPGGNCAAAERSLKVRQYDLAVCVYIHTYTCTPYAHNIDVHIYIYVHMCAE